MCSIHIWEITTRNITTFEKSLHPSFKHWKRQNIYTRKADWSEKNWFFSLATRNQLLLEQESTKTMPERTKMPSQDLFKERSKFFTSLQVVEYILLSSTSEKWDMMLVSFETNMIVIQKNASVRFSTKPSSVNHLFYKSPTK